MVLGNETMYVLYRKAGWVTKRQAVDARESSWKWVSMSIPIVDG